MLMDSSFVLEETTVYEAPLQFGFTGVALVSGMFRSDLGSSIAAATSLVKLFSVEVFPASLRG